MKKTLAICLCILMLACAPTTQQEETPAPNTTEPDAAAPIEAEGSPEPQRYPVTEATADFPETIEPINLEDHLLVYESGGVTYLYAYGESIPLHQGGIYGSYGPYNYLTEGTAFTFIEPTDGTLRIIDLNDPHKDPVTIDPETVNGVKRFAISQSGNEILFLKDEGEQNGEPVEALYYYANGEAKRIEESVGSVDQFSLSLDGKSYVFYVDEQHETESSLMDYIVMEGSEPILIENYLEWISEDMRIAMTSNGSVIGDALTLYRAGKEPLLLSNECFLVEQVTEDGDCWWTDDTPSRSLWHFDGEKTTKVGDDMHAARITKTGAYAYFQNGVFWARYRDGEPVRLCSEDEFAGGSFREDERTLVYSTATDPLEQKNMAHRTTYAVTVDENGVSEPALLAENNYFNFFFCDGQLIVRSEDMSLCDLYFNDWLLGTNVRFWSNTRFFIDTAGENLFFISEGRLYHFDGKSLKVILETDPARDELPLRYLDGGTVLYRDGDVLYCYDGTAFHRILEGVDRYSFVSFLKDALDERIIRD